MSLCEYNFKGNFMSSLKRFYILKNNTWVKVPAVPIKKYGVEFFILSDNGKYIVYEAESGLSVGEGSKEECLYMIEETFTRLSKEELQMYISFLVRLSKRCSGYRQKGEL